MNTLIEREELIMFCPNCGSKMMDGAVFCGNCGTKLAAPQTAAGPAEPDIPVVEMPVVDMPALHTIEHLGATYLRNSNSKNDIVYFGPMGCRPLRGDGTVTSETAVATGKEEVASAISATSVPKWGV